MRKKKVLHILHEIDFSGAEIMLNNSAKSFISKNFELYALNTDVKLGSYSKILANSGFQIIHLPLVGFFDHFKRFYQLVKKEKFDIIHNHTEQSFFWYSLFSRIAGIKFIYTVHNAFEFSPVVRLKRTIYRFIAKHILKTQFISISKSVQNNEDVQFFNQTTLIHNWINRDVYFPVNDISEKYEIRRKLNLPKDRFILISVGFSTIVKNHIDIIKALPIIKEKYKDILYLNIGNGPMKNYLESQVELLDLKNNVIFLGQQENVRDYLVASDVFVMPSKFEGLGNALLEALSCELPTIAYNVRGLKDLIIDGKNGFLIPEKHEAIAEKVIFLYENPQFAKQMGKESGIFVSENYNMCKSIEKLINLYSA